MTVNIPVFGVSADIAILFNIFLAVQIIAFVLGLLKKIPFL